MNGTCVSQFRLPARSRCANICREALGFYDYCYVRSGCGIFWWL